MSITAICKHCKLESESCDCYSFVRKYEFRSLEDKYDVLMTLFKKGVVTLTGNINSLKKKVKALESVLLDDEGDSWIEIFNKAIFDKDGFNEIRNLEKKIEALEEKVKKLEAK